MNHRDEGQITIIAKHVEIALQDVAARWRQAVAGIKPIIQTPGTVTLRRADYETLVRLCERLPE